MFAGNDQQQTFVAGLFPEMPRFDLPGYNVTYGTGALMPALLRQLPGLFASVRREHLWLERFVRDQRIDGIISDNRYGLWHHQVPSVILTHQLQIRTGFGQWADALLRKVHERFLRRFHACWVVDIPGAGNLGGTLSHPTYLFPEAWYIGWLSQFSAFPATDSDEHLLILLSGPEPQRTMLADALWQQAVGVGQPVVFVEGKAGATRKDIPPHIRHYARLSGGELQKLLIGSSLVICRSGYSSLMDLVLLQRRAILIPTPGQTEQEYLARTLSERKIFFAAAQHDFRLGPALDAANGFPFLSLFRPGAHEQYKPVLADWVNRLPTARRLT